MFVDKYLSTSQGYIFGVKSFLKVEASSSHQIGI